MKLKRPYIPIAPAPHQASNRYSQARFQIQANAANGQTGLLIELLKKFPRRAKDALFWAAGNGHAETVAALLRDGPPTTDALAAAKSNNHQSIVRMIERKYAEFLRQPPFTL